MGVSKDQVLKALDALEIQLEEETVAKGDGVGEEQMNNAEGADLGNPAKEKLSDKSKAAKAMEPEEQESEEDDEEGEDMEKMSYGKKSFQEEMPEEVQTKIDVSEFLKSLVDHTGNVIDELRNGVAKSEAAHESRYNELNDVIGDVMQSQAKIGVVLKAICERIGVIENAPARPAKADTVAKSGEKVERNFASGLEGEGNEKVFKSLSDNPVVAKSQIANAICDLVKKGEASDLDVIGFESTSFIRPEIATKLKQTLN